MVLALVVGLTAVNVGCICDYRYSHHSDADFVVVVVAAVVVVVVVVVVAVVAIRSYLGHLGHLKLFQAMPM